MFSFFGLFFFLFLSFINGIYRISCFLLWSLELSIRFGHSTVSGWAGPSSGFMINFIHVFFSAFPFLFSQLILYTLSCAFIGLVIIHNNISMSHRPVASRLSAISHTSPVAFAIGRTFRRFFSSGQQINQMSPQRQLKMLASAPTSTTEYWIEKTNFSIQFHPSLSCS